MSDTVHLKQLIDRLEGSRDLSDEEFTELLLCEDSEESEICKRKDIR